MKLFKDESFNIPNYIEEHNKVLSKLDFDSLQEAIDMVMKTLCGSNIRGIL